jgi:hypothetical protein
MSAPPTLDEASQFQPMLDFWTSSADSWVCLDRAIPHYPESPVDRLCQVIIE